MSENSAADIGPSIYVECLPGENKVCHAALNDTLTEYTHKAPVFADKDTPIPDNTALVIVAVTEHSIRHYSTWIRQRVALHQSHKIPVIVILLDAEESDFLNLDMYPVCWLSCLDHKDYGMTYEERLQCLVSTTVLHPLSGIVGFLSGEINEATLADKMSFFLSGGRYLFALGFPMLAEPLLLNRFPKRERRPTSRMLEDMLLAAAAMLAQQNWSGAISAAEKVQEYLGNRPPNTATVRMLARCHAILREAYSGDIDFEKAGEFGTKAVLANQVLAIEPRTFNSVRTLAASLMALCRTFPTSKLKLHMHKNLNQARQAIAPLEAFCHERKDFLSYIVLLNAYANFARGFALCRKEATEFLVEALACEDTLWRRFGIHTYGARRAAVRYTTTIAAQTTDEYLPTGELPLWDKAVSLSKSLYHRSYTQTDQENMISACRAAGRYYAKIGQFDKAHECLADVQDLLLQSIRFHCTMYSFEYLLAVNTNLVDLFMDSQRPDGCMTYVDTSIGLLDSPPRHDRSLVTSELLRQVAADCMRLSKVLKKQGRPQDAEYYSDTAHRFLETAKNT